jgi:hypothetical protein
LKKEALDISDAGQRTETCGEHKASDEVDLVRGSTAAVDHVTAGQARGRQGEEIIPRPAQNGN